MSGQLILVVSSIHIQIAKGGNTLAYWGLESLNTLGHKYKDGAIQCQGSLGAITIRDNNCHHNSHGKTIFSGHSSNHNNNTNGISNGNNDTNHMLDISFKLSKTGIPKLDILLYIHLYL